MESILWKLWDYRPSIASSEIQHIRFARILLKSLIAALKDKKQNQKAKTKTEHIKIIIVSIGVDIVAKTDDEIYALHIIKTYSFHLFSLLCQRSSCEDIEGDVATLKILTTMRKSTLQVKTLQIRE